MLTNKNIMYIFLFITPKLASNPNFYSETESFIALISKSAVR